MTRPDLEELLREALEREAQSYEPHGDGLAQIRERLRDRRERRRWLWPSAALAGLAAAAAAVIFLLPGVTGGLSPTPVRSGATGNAAGHGHGTVPTTGPAPGESAPASPQPHSGKSSAPAGGGGASSPSPGHPAGGPGTGGSPGTSGSDSGGSGSGGSSGAGVTGGGGGSTGGATRAVAVYYADGDRLVREFHPHPVTRSVIRAAVTAMLTDPSQDPDYRGLWPAGTEVLGVSRDPGQGLATVDLSAAPISASAAQLAVQQVVYTVTAADPATARVLVEVNGAPLAAPAGRAADVLAPVWVLAPAEGGSVATTFTASGTASVFEGTVSWQLVDSTGAVVAHGSAQASAGAPARGSWSATVTAPGPGTYTFVAYEASARDGSAQWPDSKTVLVH